MVDHGDMSSAGRDLVLGPVPGARVGVVIPAAELTERFSRSSGPGGQGVNTTDSRVELLFDPGQSRAFTPEQRDRVVQALESRLVDGRITLVGNEYRSQLRNRDAVRARLAALLTRALTPPAPPRRTSRPTRASKLRRLETKRRRALLKSNRRRPASE